MTAGVDIDRVTALIAEIAAEEIMPRFTKLAAGDVREKAPGDLVTIADEATEHRLTPLLTQLLPGSCVLGEEGAAASPALFDRLAGDAPVWVIDPVDGTSNFAAGAGDFGVMVALVRHDAVLAGWIHDPRTGETVTAEQGAAPGSRAGVFMWPNRRPIRLSSAACCSRDSSAIAIWASRCSRAATG